ncbi:NAD-dependent succinate-semialdehyde dehydrogenase [Desulforhabdus amnigena]|uniref:Succinate-semialdehyde dehydrogenase n=1 Tax=Desulforhabdus amnigena TaxID=40218 RepID=A0A9W6L921_9BACT|nr:NAD-dependent succinate-semialdehyde dehydrogenase [Desulforhabdus amnigena]GLI36207.1 succinate-semialdehyde dehydrogenase [Desulforhabdus amnigena]
MKMLSVNPFTEEITHEFDMFGVEQVDEAVQRAEEALLRWKARSVPDRVEIFKRVAADLRQHKRKYGEIITREMGKPIKQAVSEVEKCAWVCDYYVEHAARFLQPESIKTDAAKSTVYFEPLGIILGIMPWNFPFWQVFRFAVPAMAAGNVCLLKHASNVPLAALEIEKIFTSAGMPTGVFQTLLIDAGSATRLIEEGKVAGVSLTGSLVAGSRVGEAAGRNIKKLVLELGGSDPFIVLDDADLSKAAEVGMAARALNTGQSCIAAKRFIVMDSVVEEFQVKFLEYLRMLHVGNPMDEDTDIGPLAKSEFVEDLNVQLQDAIDKGATIFYGSKPPEGKGFFFQPAVLVNVKADMKVAQEEVFGPLAPIVVVKDEEEAVAWANATKFGLGASIWSRDVERAVRLAQRIQSGFVAINDMVKSDPRLPFGGIKKSGMGRELSHYGLKEFVNIKTVVVN